ncbi:MAG: Protein-O-mannosyltransferase, partial [uncultured Blastococcus sp.]
ALPQRPVDAAPVGVRPLVVAGQRPADPAVEPPGPHRRRRRAGGPLHPDGRDADPVVPLRARDGVAGLAEPGPARPRRGRRAHGDGRRLADLAGEHRPDDVHLLPGAGAALLRAGRHPAAAGRARPARADAAPHRRPGGGLHLRGGRRGHLRVLLAGAHRRSAEQRGVAAPDVVPLLVL